MTGDTHSTGIQGEELACRYLMEKGYQIIDRNWWSGQFEIDIIARDGDTVVFCEVKTARSRRYGSAIDWVTPRKVVRIAKTALDYIAIHDIRGCPFRFDVIGLEIKDGKRDITHIENAFDAPGAL